MVTATPDLLITPHQGSVWIITLDNVFAGISLVSVNGKSPVQNTYGVLSNAIIVLLVPDGSSLTLATDKVKFCQVLINQSVRVTPIEPVPCLFAIGIKVSVHDGAVPDFVIVAGVISEAFVLVSETLPEQVNTLSTS